MTQAATNETTAKAHAYYDKTLTKTAVQHLLSGRSAVIDRKRSNSTRKVYTLSGGGEALLEAVGDSIRVRLYAGACPC